MLIDDSAADVLYFSPSLNCRTERKSHDGKNEVAAFASCVVRVRGRVPVPHRGGGGLLAADLPAVIDGTLTLTVAAGVTETYEAALPAATTLVKTGPGTAILKAATTAFAGRVDIREGTLTLADREAAGSNTKIEVTGDAATLHLNFPRPSGASQSQAFFTGHDVTIRGQGVDGKGAFRYTATTEPPNANDDSMLDTLTLSGDAAIAIPSRFGIKDALNLNGYTLARVDGTDAWMWYSPSCQINAGIISNAVGIVRIQWMPAFTAPDETTLCMAGGELSSWWQNRALPCRLVLCGARVETLRGTVESGNRIASACAITADTKISPGSSEYSLEFTGEMALGANLWKLGSGTLYLNGPIEPTVSGKNFTLSDVGRVVCSSNVTRRISSGLLLTGASARLDLEDGLLNVGWVRLGNGGAVRNAFLQSGGEFIVRGDTYVGEGNGSYGAWMMSGGMATFSNVVFVSRRTGSEGLVWQSGGTLRTRGSSSYLHVGSAGRGFVGVFGGATNDTRRSRYDSDRRIVLGGETGGTGTLVVSGAGSTVDTEVLLLGMTNVVAVTNIVAVTDGATLKARRFYRSSGASSASDVYVDGGTVMPTFWTGWNNVDSTKEQFFQRSPDFWTLGPNGMAIDTSELDGGSESDQTGSRDSDWPHALSDATGQGLATVTLPDADEAFAQESYCGPAFVDIEGPAGSHGAAAMAAFDPATKKLTHVVVVSPGCGYDETTRVYVRSAAKTDRYACSYTLTGARAGGRLVKRGAYGVALHGTNTYTGGTVVEAGRLTMKGEKSFPANTPLKVMDGAVFANANRALAVSTLGGAGGTMTSCAGVTVGEALEITVAELFAASGPLVVESEVTFAEGVVVRVTDPENLPAHQEAGARPFLRATGGFAGVVPRLKLVDATGKAWKTTRSGNVLRLAPERGLLMLIR